MTVLAALFALSLAATGCKDEKKLTPPPPVSDYLAQSSAANVLANLQTAYGKESIGEYRKLFEEAFTFVFNPSDVSGDDPTPAQWGLADELESAANMFADSSVSRIELSSYTLGVPERADSLYYGPRTWKVRVDQANLQVHTRNDTGEPLIYLVDGTTEMFFFREEPTRPASDGKPTWFIFRWEDQPIRGVKVADKSWGQIKAVYL
jgi:hypothetical protein